MSVKRIPNNSKNRLSAANDFEKDRHCLLKLYHSNIQTHAGYIIALAIGSLSLISNYQLFFPQDQGYLLLMLLALFFDVSLSIIIGLTLYVIFRVDFWTKLANYCIVASRDNSEKVYRAWCDEQERERKDFDKGEHLVLPFTFKIEKAALYHLKSERVFSHIKWAVVFCCIIFSLFLFIILFQSNIFHLIP